MQIKKINKIIEGVKTSDGAGVRLTRIISQSVMKETDPLQILQ